METAEQNRAREAVVITLEWWQLATFLVVVACVSLVVACLLVSSSRQDAALRAWSRGYDAGKAARREVQR